MLNQLLTGSAMAFKSCDEAAVTGHDIPVVARLWQLVSAGSEPFLGYIASDLFFGTKEPFSSLQPASLLRLLSSDLEISPQGITEGDLRTCSSEYEC